MIRKLLTVFKPKWLYVRPNTAKENVTHFIPICLAAISVVGIAEDL